jgi:hypothetical protein
MTMDCGGTGPADIEQGVWNKIRDAIRSDTNLTFFTMTPFSLFNE